MCVWPKCASSAPCRYRDYRRMGEASDSLMRAAMSQMNLSARAYHRVLKLARTIANLAASEHIQVTQQHVMGSLDFLQIKALAFPI